MDFMNTMKNQLNQVFTENGDKAFASTGSYCLDYFSLIGAMRNNYQGIISSFTKAFYEDKLLAIKILFYSRDIRNGLGERNSFRMAFNMICNFYPEIGKQLLKYVNKYGRYDDLLVAIDTPCEEMVITMIQNQLEKDIECKKKNKPISLLAKWMPSINTSSNESRLLANKLSKKMDMSHEEYRKMLSFLRKDLIVENNLRLLDFTFDYEKVPGCAMMKYRNAFSNHDNERYSKYLEDVKSGKKKINSGTIYPYQIINQIENKSLELEGYRFSFKCCKELDKQFIDSMDTIWNSFNHDDIDSNTIVVRDGSGSMYNKFDNVISANAIATSIAILFAERLTNSFKNKFITFSQNPRFVEIIGTNIVEKCLNVFNEDEISNTNISKVYQLILDTYKKNKFTENEYIKRIVVVSDMEFDESVSGETTFESFKKAFEELSYPFPELVFWNVCARHTHIPVLMNESNVKLISGASDKIINMIVKNESFNAYDFMIKCLSKYQEFDEIEL